MSLAAVVLLMAALFESFAQPLAILITLPPAFFGGFWLLWLLGYELDVVAFMGVIILIGIVVNNGIVLLDHMNQLRAAGMDRHEAVLAAGRDRMRAILMTAATTIIGLLPLALGGSRVGGLFYYPLALTVMGGLMSSSVLTLTVLPYINFGVEWVAESMRRLWAQSASLGSRQVQDLARA
jgi:HAE1 family hydrophobic/amphiphilic exporter-1